MDASELQKKLTYNEQTGMFVRLIKAGSSKEGSIAGSVAKDGYIRIIISGKSYAAHRLAWLYVFGTWPIGNVDHINGRRDDNRIANLRVVTHAENMQNQRKPFVNKVVPAPLGVTFHKKSGRWQAVIGIDGKKKYLGLFPTPSDAHGAYLAAKAEHHPYGNLTKITNEGNEI